jgi:hypothetical protein
MRTNTLLNAVFALSAMLPLARAQAAITFEDVSTGNVGITAAFTSGGYTFSYSSSSPIAVHGISNVTGFGASNGTNYLLYASGVGTETFTSGNGAFNLSGLDLGGWENFATTTNLTITGTRFDNTTVTFDALVTPNKFSTFVLADFTNLRSVTLGSTPGGAYVAVDNIQVSPVPEPETYAMLLAGVAMLAGVACFRRANPKSDCQT